MALHAAGQPVRVKEIIGVQIVVAHVLPSVTVHCIGAGFERRVDDAAGGVAKLGVEVAALQREFLDGIRRRYDGGVGPGIVAAIELDVVVDAVEAEIVLPFVDAIHPEISRRRAACVGGPVAAGAGSGRIGIDACRKLCQRAPVAGHKRHIVHRDIRDRLADLGILRFQQGCGSGYGYALLHIAGGQVNVDGPPPAARAR